MTCFLVSPAQLMRSHHWVEWCSSAKAKKLGQQRPCRLHLVHCANTVRCCTVCHRAGQQRVQHCTCCAAVVAAAPAIADTLAIQGCLRCRENHRDVATQVVRGTLHTIAWQQDLVVDGLVQEVAAVPHWTAV